METGFPTRLEDILSRIDAIDPISYGKSRNFIDGDVTRLSPYISRGVISTRFVLEKVLEKSLEKGYKAQQIEKLIQELAWRDFFQRVWQSDPTLIDREVRQPQSEVAHQEVPVAITRHHTGIEAVDMGVRELYNSGYMHNHVRMYVAALACNTGRSHWQQPARWMYYHLLDGDLASNNFSWQWVAGCFSNKKYVANQENINTFCYTRQQGTFLDLSYDDLVHMDIPKELKETEKPALDVHLPATTLTRIDAFKPALLYNWYNLDPFWHRDEDVQRILLLEPNLLSKYPISERSVQFMLELAGNIEGMKIFTGEFTALKKRFPGSRFVYKEHPLNRYQGTEEPRTFLHDGVTGYHSSFFRFWKKLRPLLFQARYD